MDVDIEKEELQAAVIALSEALDAVKTEKAMVSASETIDYGSESFQRDRDVVIAALAGERVADLKVLYRKPFFTTLKKDYTRAVVASACIKIAQDSGVVGTVLWNQLKENQGKLIGEQYD